MNYIDFVVRNKHIESRQNEIIADNTDYIFRFTFLGKWTEFETKTVLMLRENGKFYKCDMKDGATSFILPKFTSPLTLLIGVTAGSGEDEISTDRLLFNVRSSIRTGANEELEKPESGAEDFLAEYCRRYDELLLKLETLDDVYMLPSVTSADAGKVLRVSAAGEWEAADGDGDSKPFVVTVTYGDDGTLTADKTHAEIVEAYAAGAQINTKIVNYPGVIVPSILPLYVNNSDTEFVFSGSGVLNGRAMAMTATDTNGSWSVSLTELATPGDIPSGGTDTSLGVTGATVGQTVKIKSVGENGVPTEWEAADFPKEGWRRLSHWEKEDNVVIQPDAFDVNTGVYTVSSGHGLTEDITVAPYLNGGAIQGYYTKIPVQIFNSAYMSLVVLSDTTFKLQSNGEDITYTTTQTIDASKFRFESANRMGYSNIAEIKGLDDYGEILIVTSGQSSGTEIQPFIMPTAGLHHDLSWNDPWRPILYTNADGNKYGEKMDFLAKADIIYAMSIYINNVAGYSMHRGYSISFNGSEQGSRKAIEHINIFQKVTAAKIRYENSLANGTVFDVYAR